MSPDMQQANVELILYRINELFGKTETLQAAVTAIDTKTDSLVVDVAKLKVKSGIWGALAGAVTSAAAGLAAWVLTR